MTKKFSTTLVIVSLLVAVFGGLGAYYILRPRPEAGPPAITPEAKQYVRNLGLADVEMKATDSYMSQRVVEILGKITNNGDRKLRQVELSCVFYDPYNQLLLRERAAIVRPRSGGLAPGETKPFRLAFDTIPPNWNQALPQLVIANIEFE